MIQTISTRNGINLLVETTAREERLEVTLKAPAIGPCVLHWGIRATPDKGWSIPPTSLWPPGSQPFGSAALQTPFRQENNQAKVQIQLPAGSPNLVLEFALYFPDNGRWDNNGNQNYQVPLAEAAPGPIGPVEELRSELGSNEVLFERVFDLGGGGQLAVATSKQPQRHCVLLVHNLPGAWLLHWGVAQRSPHEWLLPPGNLQPPGTTLANQTAAQTPFAAHHGLQILRLEFPETDGPLGVQFVLRQTDWGGRWLNYRGGNFYVPIQGALPQYQGAGVGALASLADQIVQAETTRNSWTLMHRFNLCHDLLDRGANDPGALALIYVWLRFSAIRQLTWQKNYNTKPRELAHAQDRLTLKLAGMYRGAPAGRPVLRLMLTTVGRGGEGQRIRDEILNIMHRHHVKEVSGHFLEEWHQKLHNNTTPDDVVICEAYLEFLRSHGSQERFYQTLEAGGVNRQRLASFERPIRSQPDFVPHLRDGLLHDFGNFLHVLKAAHSGTDFETAVSAAQGRVDGDLRERLAGIARHRNDDGDGLIGLVNQIGEARHRLSHLLQGSDGLRELLYLDLALEQLLRGAVERNLHLRLGGEALADLIARVLENVTLSYEDPELAACSHHWQRLQSQPRFSPEWSLHAKSVTDRATRGLSAWIDRFYEMLQPKAEYLGQAFRAEPWTVTLFSEEVVRGSSLGFVLSMLLHQLDPLLRKSARLGAWQIISRGDGAGTVEVIGSLRSVQRKQFSKPVVLVADQVAGDEEIPEGVTAVLAPDVTDVVSHVAVRARNGKVLFAACHDPELLASIKALQGHHLNLTVSAAGDILMQETAAAGEAVAIPSSTRTTPLRLTPHHFTAYALSLDEFHEQNVGGKSLHQARLRGLIADTIGLPRSVAVPFGVCETVLKLEINQAVGQRYARLAHEAQPGSPETLAALRETVMSLAAPEELRLALHHVMDRARMVWPGDWDKMWDRIKQVWASKWNERACLSRQKMGIPHEALSMAVLIQEVVPADYAYVIHTVNPSNGNASELFAEVVLGLGETLVGNFPGRALSFVFNKSSGQPTVLSYPSKSLGLYAGGLIFRSDSNGEDLEGYAGAGLYDSVLLEPARQAILDYAQEPLVWDEGFRRDMLASIARIGLEIERVCGAPQDIEGAVAQGRYYVVQTRPQAGAEAKSQTPTRTTPQ